MYLRLPFPYTRSTRAFGRARAGRLRAVGEAQLVRPPSLACWSRPSENQVQMLQTRFQSESVRERRSSKHMKTCRFESVWNADFGEDGDHGTQCMVKTLAKMASFWLMFSYVFFFFHLRVFW
jgi:hypothetical protein